MILSLAIVNGFQSQIRDKVIGFGAHIQITHYANSGAYESAPVLKNQSFYPGLNEADGVRHIQIYATKAGIVETKEDIQGVVVKGIGSDFDWSFFEDKIVDGKLLQLNDSTKNDSILVSKRIAQKLKLKLGDKLNTYFFGVAQNKPGSQITSKASTLSIGNEQSDQQVILLINKSRSDSMVVSKAVATTLQLNISDKLTTRLFLESDASSETQAFYESRPFTIGDIQEKQLQDWNASMLTLTNGKDSVFFASSNAIGYPLNINSRVTARLLKEAPVTVQSYKVRPFYIGGIYETGMEEIDKRVILADIQHIQKLNKWGIEAHILVNDETGDSLEIEGIAYSNTPNLDYQWSIKGLRGKGPHKISASADSMVQLIVSDVSYVSDSLETIPDTALLYWNSVDGMLETREVTSGGSGKYYTGGFEVLIDEYDDLSRMDEIIYQNIGFNLNSTTILNEYPEIFGWLEMIDINVYVIIILMIGVALINMTAALLTLILERTNMIGVLKALGAPNWSIRKIFLYNATYLIGKGLIYGNIIGLLLCFIQYKFGVITLPQENYYVSIVPINLNFYHLLYLNVGTLLICSIVLILPSYLVTKISPIKAIRFN